MLIRYKINNLLVEPHIFKEAADNKKVAVWEQAIYAHQTELQNSCASVILQIADGNLIVVTDTKLLFKLYNAVQFQLAEEKFAINV